MGFEAMGDLTARSSR